MTSISTGRIGGMTKDGILWDGYQMKNNDSSVAQAVSDLRNAGVAVPMIPIKVSQNKNLTSDQFVLSNKPAKTEAEKLVSDLRNAGVAVPMMPIKFVPKS